MNAVTKQRLFGYNEAFAQPMTVWIILVVAAGLFLGGVAIYLLGRSKKLPANQLSELRIRYFSWLVLVPLMLLPILLGAFWTITAITILTLLCYREFARVTGLFREKVVSAIVVLGILALWFATLDHWYHFFVALMPLTVVLLAAVPIFSDRPHGYIQRVGLGVLAYSLLGTGLGHLGFIANDASYRPILLMLLLTVEINDVFAYVVGKTLGKRKLAPNTSPGKTIAGSMGAVLLTTPLVAVLTHFIFAGSSLDRWYWLLLLGVFVSVGGQLGDLMLSSIKRDVGIKDTGKLIPGHGGLLDRFDSLILVAPVVFHYLKYFVDLGMDQPVRIFTSR